MKKSSLLMIVGAVVTLLLMLNSRIFDAPPYIIISGSLAGIACLVIGYNSYRTALANNRPRKASIRYYAVLILTVVAGVVLGFFGYRKIHPEEPMWIPVASSVIAFVLGVTYYSWDIFVRSRVNS